MSLPDPREIANFPHGNPKAKIVQERERLYVCEREYYWDSEAKRGRERRLYLGRIVEGVYYTTEEYRRKFKRDGSLREPAPTPKRSYRRKPNIEEAASPGSAEKDKKAFSTASPSAKRVGMTALLTTICRQTGLWRDVTDTFGGKACCIAHSLAYHWPLSRDGAASLFASWCEGYRLPASERLTGADCLEFFQSLGETPQWEESFLRARQASFGRLHGMADGERITDDDLIAYDASVLGMSTAASNDRCGAPEEKGCASGLGILMSKETGLPAVFRVVPGGIADAVTFVNLLTLTDRPFPSLAGSKVFAAVMESDRWSLSNLRRALEAG